MLAATPELIQLDTEGDSLPQDFVQVGDVAFFVASTEELGRELWKTDGTAEGTTLVRDILTGTGSSDPQSLTEFNGHLYFSADDGNHGRELWRSDGTAEGTILVRDVRPGEGYQWPTGDGPYSSNPQSLTGVNGKLFFSATGPTSGTELWLTDGTAEGTQLVKDIAPGTTDDGFGEYPNSSSPSQLTSVNGILYFAADDGENGEELWKSDGTESGTVMVRDINTGSGYQYYYGYGPFQSTPRHLTNVNGKLFFTAVTKELGEELWMSDGTESGTILVKDIAPGDFNTEYGVYPRSSYPRDLTELNGVLFFTAFNIDDGEELWRSDGTEAGTTMVKDILPGSGDGTYDAGLVVFKGMLFFAAEDNDHGTELWRSDGTESGTVLVADISSGTPSSLPKSLTAANGILYFAAQDNNSGTELWQTDGSSEGTIQVADLFSGTRSSAPHELFDLNDTLLFAAEDSAVGVQLWTLEPELSLGTITGRKFEDLDADGVADAEEPGLEGLRVFIDANDDGQWNNGERSAITDATGHYVLQAPAGLTTLRAARTANKIQTVPLPADHYSLTVEVGQTYSNLDFGEATLPPPMTIDLLAESDHGAADDDDITNLNNDSSASVLQFRLTGIATTGEVLLFASGTLIGSTMADGSEIVLTTDGQTTVPDGSHEITAVQRFQGVESAASSPLVLQIDSQPPSPMNPIPLLEARVEQLFSYDVDSEEETSPDTEYVLAGAPTGMTIDSNGLINWTPTAEQAIPQNFQVLLRDTAGNATAEEVTIEVLGKIPAYADAYEVDEDTLLDVSANNGVLANDGDDLPGPFLALMISAPSHGEITFLVDGSFSYLPQTNFHGTDRFRYQASAGDDVSNIAEVTITVHPVNDVPIGTADAYATTEDTELIVNAADGVLKNDLDVEGESLTAVLLTNPTHGTVQFQADGSFRYTPASNYFGNDAFTYAARDATTSSDAVTVSLSVSPVNDPPIAEPDTYSVNEDGVLTVTSVDSLLNNDSDTEGDSITARLEAPPSHGTVNLQADGTLIYEPDADFFGSDLFSYVVSDGILDSSPATVTVTVNPVADPPQAIDDSFEVFNDETVHRFNVLVNDSTEPDGQQTLQLISVTQGTAGQVSIVDGEIQYTVSTGYVGTDTFTYTIEDSDGLTDIGTVTVEVIDASMNSLAGYVYVDLNEDGTHDLEEPGVPGVLITLTGTTNADESITQTAITLNDGRYRFNDLPAGTYQVTKSQAHAMQDGAEATTVPGATAEDDHISDLVLVGGQVWGGNDFAELRLKPEYLSIAWFFASSTPPSNIFRETIAIGEEDANNDALAEEIRNVDQEAASSENRAPTGTDDEYETAQNEPLIVPITSGVLANDVDSDDDPLMATLITSPNHGTFSLRPNGSFVYTPEADFTGDDSFTYRVSDGFSQTSPVVVTLQVQPADGLPNGTAATGFVDAAEQEPDSDEMNSDLLDPQWIDQAFFEDDLWL